MKEKKEGNREYRSDVFSMLMADKKNALQVYNALNGTQYDDPELVEIHTMEKGVSLSIRNDSAIVVDSSLSLYEHQSTVCPNMPLRSLFYVSNILRRMTKDEDIFGSGRIPIPLPKFAVFYNGTKDMPCEWEERLSDAFLKKTDKPELELVCKVYNINQDKGKKLLDSCTILHDYMMFVDYVRLYLQEKELKDAINAAIDRCIQEEIQPDFFKENREEILRMAELDFTFERRLELGVKSALKQGKEEGWAEASEIINKKDEQLKEMDVQLNEKEYLLNEKDEEIKRLKAQLESMTV